MQAKCVCRPARYPLSTSEAYPRHVAVQLLELFRVAALLVVVELAEQALRELVHQRRQRLRDLPGRIDWVSAVRQRIAGLRVTHPAAFAHSSS